MSITAKELVTAEELWAMAEVPGKQLELIDGEIVEVAGAGVLHGLIVELVLRILGAFVRERNLGLVLPDNTACILRREPDAVRIPDTAFVSWERLRPYGIPQGFLPLAPDLAVEVVSPNDSAEEVYTKVHEYLEAGTMMVWVLWPTRRSITVYGPQGAITELGPADSIDGGDVLSGFREMVSAFFATPVEPDTEAEPVRS